MKTSAIFTLLLGLGDVQGQGMINLLNPQSVSYRIERIVDSCDPSGPREGVVENVYSAELWYALGISRTEESLLPLADAQGRLDARGVLLPGRVVHLDGTFGGEYVTLQLRVWENRSGATGSWSEALARPELALGRSELVNYQLGGSAADGTPILAKNFAHLLPSFTLSTVCPEPSGYLLLGLTAGGLWWFRRRKNHR
jgi:hypothetical protein